MPCRVMETKAHDMNLFLATKSEAGHDCAPLTATLLPPHTSFYLSEYAEIDPETGNILYYDNQ